MKNGSYTVVHTYQLPTILTALLHADLINVGYLTVIIRP